MGFDPRYVTRFRPVGNVFELGILTILFVLTDNVIKLIKANIVLPERCMVARSVCFLPCSMSAL